MLNKLAVYLSGYTAKNTLTLHRGIASLLTKFQPFV